MGQITIDKEELERMIEDRDNLRFQVANLKASRFAFIYWGFFFGLCFFGAPLWGKVITLVVTAIFVYFVCREQ